MLPFTATAQEKTGISLSNFAGINSVYLNPSFSSNSKLFADLNAIAGGVFFDNNFVYIHKEDYHLFSFLKKNPTIPSLDVRGQGLDYSLEGKPVDGILQAQIYGPGFSYSTGKRTFGFTTKVSSITSISNIPYKTAVMAFEGLDSDSLLGVNVVHGQFEVPSLIWWEFGGHYSQIVRERNRNVWSVGVNIRKLFAFAGGYATGNAIDYTLDSDTLMNETIHNLNIGNLDASAAFSIPLNYDSIFLPTAIGNFKGGGWAGDIGITFRKNREESDNFRYRRSCEKNYEDYIYKIGLSLIDIGNIVFKKNVQIHDYHNVTANWRNIEDLNYENINQMTQQISYELTGDTLTTLREGTFAIGLPAAFSVQADYQYFPNWYISGFLMAPLNLNNVQLRRPKQAMVSLRYESPVFEFGIPVSLYNFEVPRIGLYARLGYFTVGSDKLGGFFGFNDFYGLDFYFSVKMHILKGLCGLNKPTKDCNHLAF